jgi:hypothetical protein
VLAVTVNDAGALPLAGDTDNHDASSDALKLNDPVPVFVTDNDCPAGLAPPAVPENDNDPGDTDNTDCGGEPPPTRYPDTGPSENRPVVDHDAGNADNVAALVRSGPPEPPARSRQRNVPDPVLGFNNAIQYA